MNGFLVAALQVPVVTPGSFAEFADVCAGNARRVAAAVERLTDLGDPARLICLGVQPFSGGSASLRRTWPDPPPFDEVAVDLSGPLLDPLVEVCARRDCYVAGSVLEKVHRLPGRFFHTGFVVGPQGLALRSPKAQARSVEGVISLRDMVDEYRAAFGGESILPVVDTPYGRLACVVEREIYAPEVGRALAARGAEVVLHPAGDTMAPVGAERFAPEVEIRAAFAYTHALYLVSAGRSRLIGADPDRQGQAVSTVMGPDGAVLARLGPGGEGAVLARVDLDARRDLAGRQQVWTRPAPFLGGPA